MYANDVEGDFIFKAWQIINEISDQLAHNQKFASSLLSQAESLKVRSPHLASVPSLVLSTIPATLRMKQVN